MGKSSRQRGPKVGERERATETKGRQRIGSRYLMGPKIRRVSEEKGCR